jgi:hypothetical protein
LQIRDIEVPSSHFIVVPRQPLRSPPRGLVFGGQWLDRVDDRLIDSDSRWSIRSATAYLAVKLQAPVSPSPRGHFLRNAPQSSAFLWHAARRHHSGKRRTPREARTRLAGGRARRLHLLASAQYRRQGEASCRRLGLVPQHDLSHTRPRVREASRSTHAEQS